MTESDWLSSTDPLAMLSFFRDRGPVSERKLRLAGCECSSRVVPLLDDQRLAELVTVAERVADGVDVGAEVTAILTALQADEPGELSTAQHNGRAGVAFAAAHPPDNRWYSTAIDWLACAAAWVRFPTATVDPDDFGGLPQDPDWQVVWRRECEGQAAVLRDIFGNPFRPISFSPSWRTEAVVALARGIYEERAFERMSVLADALEDAGCDSAEALEHCRGPNVHVRGCWVVDSVLGRE